MVFLSPFGNRQRPAPLGTPPFISPSYSVPSASRTPCIALPSWVRPIKAPSSITAARFRPSHGDPTELSTHAVVSRAGGRAPAAASFQAASRARTVHSLTSPAVDAELRAPTALAAAFPARPQTAAEWPPGSPPCLSRDAPLRTEASPPVFPEQGLIDLRFQTMPVLFACIAAATRDRT